MLKERSLESPQSKTPSSRASSKSYPLPTPNRRDRRLEFGIDMLDTVVFGHWEPGGEHVKQIIVKNVLMKTQKIKYKLPKTRYFSMEFPKTVTLSAGMSWTIPITFRPLAKEIYSDVVEFTTSFGKFNLPVKAVLPEHVLEFPRVVDFQYCPVNETASNNFVLRNTGELGTSYEWQVPEPFSIIPQKGFIESGRSISVKVEFNPTTACFLEATAVCVFGDKARWNKTKLVRPMKISGIGKFSFLSIVDDCRLYEFEKIFVGKSVSKTFTIQNPSLVDAKFAIKGSEPQNVSCFELSTYSGVVPSNKKLEITITYNPVASGLHSIEYFTLYTVSGNNIVITCTGTGIGPHLVLGSQVVNFGDISAGQTVTRSLTIQNTTNSVSFYQFLTEKNGVFRIDKPFGTLNPFSSLVLTLKFSATEPINYYKRIYCLVENQDALFVDFIGTVFTDKRRPATFSPKFLTNYQERIKNGLWSYGPEHLEEMLKNDIVTCRDGIWSFIDPDDQAKSRTMIATNFTEIERHIDQNYDFDKVGSEYFFSNTGNHLPCTLLDTYVEFGACSRYRMVESQPIRIANNTTGKMSCVWVMPGELTGEESTFFVSPNIADIPAKSTAEFRVHFRPTIENSFYGAQLECFVYFKSMRSFRLVNDDTFTPPWCLTPLVSGNTIPPGEDTFIPKVTFGETRLDFPACQVHRSIYRTVRVSNGGDTPVRFSFPNSRNLLNDYELDNVFSVKPRVGMLHSNESRLILFRFSPTEQKLYENVLKCQFNSSLTNTYDLEVRGEGSLPKISFENGGLLRFRPTCVGATSERKITAQNSSKIVINFEWKLPTQYLSLISISPLKGTLSPNETIEMKCVFSPKDNKSWVLKIPCFYYHSEKGLADNSSLLSQKKSTLTILCSGTFGKIICDPKTIDFGVILVNTVSDKEITLYNNNECDLNYALEIHETLDGHSYSKMEYSDKKYIPPNLRICSSSASNSRQDFHTFTDKLSAKSRQILKLQANPKEGRLYKFKIFYSLLTTNDDLLTENSLNLLCDVYANGVQPLLQITDVRSEGRSKSILWQLLSLDLFNASLKKKITDPMAYADFSIDRPRSALPEGEFKRRYKDVISFDFGASPVGYQPTSVSLVLENEGVVPVDWFFYFPNDLAVDHEEWADSGEYTEDQIHENLIIDNNLFQITPKNGHLDPGKSVHVLLSYAHEFAGLHQLPVLFKLKNGFSRSGKELLIKFSGHSVIKSKPFLQIPCVRYELEPIKVGDMNPPIQLYQVMNKSNTSLEYEVDSEVLESLKSSNSGFDILRCANMKGMIPPNEIGFLEWIFRPLTNEVYRVDIPIFVKNGPSSIISLSATGYSEDTAHEHQKLDPKVYPDSIPVFPMLQIAQQNVILSRERLNYGHCPLGATLRQIVVVQNQSSSSVMTFKWKIPAFWGENVIRISPTSGILQANESRICKITFRPRFVPKIYDLDLICEITDKESMDEYLAKKEVEEKKRREILDMEGASLPETPASMMSSKSDLNRYKALPAIGEIATSRDSVSIAASEESLQEQAIQVILPPPSYDLILTVKTRTYDPEEFRDRFEGYETFHFEKQTIRNIPNDNCDDDTVMCDTIKGVMLSILDNLLEDSDIRNIVTEKSYFPFYSQIVSNARNGIFAESCENKTKSGLEKWNPFEGPMADADHKHRKLDILNSLEFQNLAENVLEATIYNLMQEANAGEFEITKYPMLFTKI